MGTLPILFDNSQVCMELHFESVVFVIFHIKLDDGYGPKSSVFARWKDLSFWQIWDI